MERWKQFEDNAIDYLNENISLSSIEVKGQGKSNSNEPDFVVNHKNKKLFSGEIKLSPSQAGQFVVEYKDGKFSYSKRNKTKEDTYSKQMIGLLNKENTKYSKFGVKAIKIDFEEKLLFEWVKHHYTKMGVRFVVTSEHYKNLKDNYVCIIPIEDVEKNFAITCVLRSKKSGSRRMSKKYIEDAKSEIKSKFGNGIKMTEDGGINFKKPIGKTYLGKIFFITEKNGKNYVRILSKTCNPSPIFSLRYTGEKKSNGLDAFTKEINKCIKQI